MEMTETTDDELLARSVLRPQVLGALYERHAAAVFRFLARRVGPAAAEDLVGEVFVAALESRVRYRPHESGSALPWLYGIGGNVARTHLRRRRPDVAVDKDVGVDWAAVDARLDAQATRDQLRRALVTLTPHERETFLLVAWEGLTPTQAAHALGVPATVVRARLSRARRRARTVLTVAPLPTA